MADTSELLTLLACPRCDKSPLDSSADGYRCSGCRIDFPLIDGVPWLFAEPHATLAEWRGRLAFSISKLEHDRAELAAALESKTLAAPTRQRLTHLAQATSDHTARLRALLAPLQLDTATAEHATYLALRTRLPADQGLTTYYNNVFRDWAWGKAENEASLDVVRGALADAAPGRMLILGAGAGRLAYDLHMHVSSAQTVMLDFNPLLMLLARRITGGESIELHEFPIAPKTIEAHAVLRTLAAEQPARDGLHCVLGDAHRPPFAGNAFDTIVTPWLIDILPERFENLCARINSLLADGGRWVNFGSLSFHDPDPARCYSLEECVNIVTEAGFDSPAVVETELPYMCSPASRHGRREQVLSWTAAKIRGARRAPRHEALPDWLVRGKDPVPLLDSFRMQAMSTRIHAFIMSLIDGRRSLNEMAGLVAEQKLMTREEAEPAIRSFLIKMYEDSRRSGNY